LFIITFSSLAQETEKTKIDWNLNGNVGLAFGKTKTSNYLFLNYGGPNAKLNIKEWNIGLSMYPSLRFDMTKNKFIPTLGSGIFVGKNKWSIIFPCYYLSNTDSWLVSTGFSYRFK